MAQTDLVREPVVDRLTVVAIAALAISLNVGLHEGVHALACLAVGGDLLEYSALYESCGSTTTLQAKIVAGSAPIFNILAGLLMWLILRRSSKRSPETRFFLWLFMLMNLFYGAGYFIFSGLANVGDWAVVIDGWTPVWVWRVGMTLLGTLLFWFFVRLSLKELGTLIGGEAKEQVHRARKLCLLSYATAFVVVALAGFFCPYGLLSLAVTAGVFAVLGALSPLLWMMRWFETDKFAKSAREPLEIHRRWVWIAGAFVVVFFYVVILGRTLYF